MITANSQQQHENTESSVRIAPRSPAPFAHSRKILRRRSMLRWRDKVRLWRDNEYLTDAFAIMFTLGIVVAAFYFGLMLGAGR